MRVVIRVCSGPYEGRMFLLRPGQTIKVGRTEWADFHIPYDERMSGVHFSVQCEATSCRLADLQSTNGTIINNQRVSSSELNDGDVIVAGRTTFRVELERAPAPAAGIVATVGEENGTSSPADVEPVTRSPFVVTVTERTADVLPGLLLSQAAERPYQEALRDPDELVRHEALMAAVWSRQRWLLEYCRAMTAQPAPDRWEEMWLLAVLGQPSDLERILRLGRSVELGPKRFQLYSSFGHPRVVRDLLIALESKDPATAVAAGQAFMKITGAQIDSSERVTLPAAGDGHDELAGEFAPQAFLPDPQKAHTHLEKVKDPFAEGARWRAGIEVSQPFAAGVLERLDMEGRWEACLRARYDGTWNGRFAEIVRYRSQYGTRPATS